MLLKELSAAVRASATVRIGYSILLRHRAKVAGLSPARDKRAIGSKDRSVSGLPQSLSLVYHATDPYPREVPLESVYADLDLPAGSSDRPFAYLNMVQTFDGQAVISGSAFTIGTIVDHHLLRQLRGHADAVLYGAGTLRTDDFMVTTHPYLHERRTRRGQTPNPLAIVASSTCEFSDSDLAKRFFTRNDFGKLVVTTPRASEMNVARVRAAGATVDVVAATTDGWVDPRALMHRLADRGIKRLLLEGGPTFNVSIARNHLIDELFVTTTLRLGGDALQPRIFAAPVTDQRLQLISEYRFQDSRGVVEYYFRFRFPR